MQLIYVSMTMSVAFLQIFRCYLVTCMLVDLSVTIMQVTVSVAVIKLEVSTAHIQMTVSAANMWVTIFIVIIQMGVSVAVRYAHDCVYCNYAGDFHL